MKTLILYETKTGFTEECALKIRSRIPDSDLHDLHEDDFSLDDYDTILIGAPIYEGELEHYAARYFDIHKRKLIKKRLGIFCAGMNREEFNFAVQNSLPPDVFYDAVIVHCGGRIEYDKLKWKDKRIIKRRLGITESQEINNVEKMDQFIKWAKNE